MLTHKAIWTAIDALAEKHGLTASGLARKAGLDPTTFNRSKRAARDGKQRWPSTESIAKVVEATGTTMAEFLEVLLDSSAGGRGSAFRIPTVDFLSLNGPEQQPGQPALPGDPERLRALFDPAGLPIRQIDPAKLDSAKLDTAKLETARSAESIAWDLRPFPGLHDDRSYALELNTHAFEPLYRLNAVLILSPRAEIRRGDRLLAATVAGEFLLCALVRKTLTRVEVSDLNKPDQERSFDTSEIAWLHRIVWATQ